MKQKKCVKIKLFIKGILSAFDATGGKLEGRNVDNLHASWENVGVFHKRAMNKSSDSKGLRRRFFEI